MFFCKRMQNVAFIWKEHIPNPRSFFNIYIYCRYIRYIKIYIDIYIYRYLYIIICWKKNAAFFYVLFFARFAIFVWLTKPKRMLCSFIKNVKERKNVPFFYKERKRTQKTLHSFLKNGKERKNVAFFWKKRVPNPGFFVAN